MSINVYLIILYIRDNKFRTFIILIYVYYVYEYTYVFISGLKELFYHIQFIELGSLKIITQPSHRYRKIANYLIIFCCTYYIYVGVCI